MEVLRTTRRGFSDFGYSFVYATGVGWIFQYALADASGKHSLADLRSYQDWCLRYYLKSVPGVGSGSI